MSNYYAPAINPRTGKVEEAEYLDNHYGPHRYGVRFPDGRIYPVDRVRPASPSPVDSGSE